MKLLHTSDLHLGRRLGEFSLYDDQRHILTQIADIAYAEGVDGVLLAGDIYDKSMPSAEAVELLDWLLTLLSERSLCVFMVSGNHDSPERVDFGGRIMERGGIHIAGVFDGAPKKHVLSDEFGQVEIFMLPFLRPVHARTFFEGDISTTQDGVRAALSGIEDSDVRRVLIAHQFVTSGGTAPTLSESENVSVGGLDSVDSSVLSLFDYVALGHIHAPQNIGGEHVRYCGSPLKYSFSEVLHTKGADIITLGKKGELEVRTVPLTPLRDLRIIRGPFAALTQSAPSEGREDFIKAIVDDLKDIYDAQGGLRQIYPNLVQLSDGAQEGTQTETLSAPPDRSMSPSELFARFYLKQNGEEMTPEQSGIIYALFSRLGGEGL
ncbi:MAG: exonuclease SbcCD subunit D [Eubacteriales bacterium]